MQTSELTQLCAPQFSCVVSEAATYETRGRDAWHSTNAVVMVTDLSSFTNLVERLGDVPALSLIQAHNDILLSRLDANCGTMVEHTGDGIISSFESAEQATVCAMELQRAFAAFRLENPATPLQIRIGIHSGSVLRNGRRLFGATLIATFRICELAVSGHTLLSQAVYRALTPPYRERARAVGDKTLKGFVHSMPLFDLSAAAAACPPDGSPSSSSVTTSRLPRR